MQPYNQAEAVKYVLTKLDRKPFRVMESEIESIIDSFAAYDTHFMRVTGVLNADDLLGEAAYDDDEAFEFIYDAYLSDHTDVEDENMLVAELLNRYMALMADYWESKA